MLIVALLSILLVSTVDGMDYPPREEKDGGKFPRRICKIDEPISEDSCLIEVSEPSRMARTIKSTRRSRLHKRDKSSDQAEYSPESKSKSEPIPKRDSYESMWIGKPECKSAPVPRRLDNEIPDLKVHYESKKKEERSLNKSSSGSISPRHRLIPISPRLSSLTAKKSDDKLKPSNSRLDITVRRRSLSKKTKETELQQQPLSKSVGAGDFIGNDDSNRRRTRSNPDIIKARRSKEHRRSLSAEKIKRTTFWPREKAEKTKSDSLSSNDSIVSKSSGSEEESHLSTPTLQSIAGLDIWATEKELAATRLFGLHGLPDTVKAMFNLVEPRALLEAYEAHGVVIGETDEEMEAVLSKGVNFNWNPLITLPILVKWSFLKKDSMVIQTFYGVVFDPDDMVRALFLLTQEDSMAYQTGRTDKQFLYSTWFYEYYSPLFPKKFQKRVNSYGGPPAAALHVNPQVIKKYRRG